MAIPTFNNIEPLELNISRIGTGTEVPENIKDYIRDNFTDWLSIPSVALFISLIVYFNVIQQYDIYKATLISSISTFIVVFSFLISGFSKAIAPLFVYGVLILVSSIAVYVNKKKGN